ncbi:hypothetical protein J2S59_000972 [Nocardioides massiliensis]|uniref:Uncharacterized protein n=1 Tax=Nocardioides massiliensis TaxID=1325935 RepID=A0ABT9NL83_9ACTN|nr:hypothetical protein [Nocardioides massiliensis]
MSDHGNLVAGDVEAAESGAPWYDRGEGRRRCRALDMGTVRLFLEPDAPRVNCTVHGPKVRQVPWTRHGAGHTHTFDSRVGLVKGLLHEQVTGWVTQPEWLAWS